MTKRIYKNRVLTRLEIGVRYRKKNRKKINKQSRIRYKKYTKKILKQNRSSRQIIRSLYVNIFQLFKSTEPCFDCGKIYPHYIMEFDHCKRKRTHPISVFIHSPGLAQKEIEKCELVCSNCHVKRTWKRKPW